MYKVFAIQIGGVELVPTGKAVCGSTAQVCNLTADEVYTEVFLECVS